MALGKNEPENLYRDSENANRLACILGRVFAQSEGNVFYDWDERTKRDEKRAYSEDPEGYEDEFLEDTQHLFDLYLNDKESGLAYKRIYMPELRRLLGCKNAPGEQGMFTDCDHLDDPNARIRDIKNRFYNGFRAEHIHAFRKNGIPIWEGDELFAACSL